MGGNKKSIWVFYQDGGTPEQGWGERHLYLAKKWLEEGHKVTIFAANRSHRYINEVHFKGKFLIEDYGGVQYCWVKVPGYKKAASLVRILSWLVYMWRLFFVPKEISRPDIVIASSIPLFPVFNALYWKRKTGCKFIFEVRDIWPLTARELGNYSKWNPFIFLLRRIEKRGYRKADHVVSVLENAHLHIRHSIKRSVDFTWISNGIPDELITKVDPAPDDIIAQIPVNKFIVGYAGSLGVANHMDPLIVAAEKLKEDKTIHFVIMGDGPEKENLQILANGLPNISFLDKVTKYQVQSVIKNFDVNFLSWNKSSIYRFGISPNKLFDYLLSEKPIIMAGDIEKSVFLTIPSLKPVPCDDAEGIIQSIIDFKNMPIQDRKALGKAGKQFLLDNFTYDKLAEKFLQIF